MNMHAAVKKGNSNKTAFTGRAKKNATGKKNTNLRRGLQTLMHINRVFESSTNPFSVDCREFSKILTHRAELITVEQPTAGQVWISWGKRVCPFHLRHNATTPPRGSPVCRVCLEAFICVNKCSPWWGSTIISQVRTTDKRRYLFYLFFSKAVCRLTTMYYFSKSFHICAAFVFRMSDHGEVFAINLGRAADE